MTLPYCWPRPLDGMILGTLYDFPGNLLQLPTGARRRKYEAWTRQRGLLADETVCASAVRVGQTGQTTSH